MNSGSGNSDDGNSDGGGSPDRGATVTPLRPRRPCPECGKPSVRETYPFCSTRCKDIDLNRWLKGAYVIPARDDEEEEGGDGSN